MTLLRQPDRAARLRKPRGVAAVLLALLVVALLWAQMLGLAHGIRHIPVPPGHAQYFHAAGATPHAQAAHAHGAPQNLLEHLAAPEGEEQDCRLYDQLGHAGPVSAQFGLQLHALPLVSAWVVLQALQPRPCVAFSARAPPLSR